MPANYVLAARWATPGVTLFNLQARSGEARPVPDRTEAVATQHAGLDRAPRVKTAPIDSAIRPCRERVATSLTEDGRHAILD